MGFDYDTTLELRLDLERKLAKAFGVDSHGEFFLGVDQAFARMDRVVHPMGWYVPSWQMGLALQRMRLRYGTDNPRDLAEAIVMCCSLEETKVVLVELGRMVRE